MGPRERESGLSVGSMGAWGVVKSLYPEEEKWNWANQATEAGKAAPGSSLLWGLGASLLWSLGWAAKLVVAMAPASSQSSKCCCSEGGDPFCGLDRPSHTSPPSSPLPFPTKAAPPYGSSSPPYQRLESRLHPGQGPTQLACQISRPSIRPQSALRGQQSLRCGQRQLLSSVLRNAGVTHAQR